MTLELMMLFLLIASLAIYLLMVGGFLVAMARRSPRTSTLPCAPRVTILKPLAGDDDELWENLQSFAAIDYPSFEILFGITSNDDPAHAVARAFTAVHPKLDARILLTDPRAAVNPKVAQLIDLDARSTGEVVVVSDANVRVSPSYLWSLVSKLDAQDGGLVTSLVAGTGERTLGAALENLQLGALVAPGVLAFAVVANKPLAVGKSMAMWRKELVRLGGFRRVGAVLAEDHILGRIFREAGYPVGVVHEPVENRNIECSIGRTFERHTRWAKMRRAIAPGHFVLEPLLYPLLVAAFAFLVTPSRLTAVVLVATTVLQTFCALLMTRLTRGHALAWRYAPLEIVRTFMIFACWVRACVSRRVTWRGHPFVMGQDSSIVPFVARRSIRRRIAA